MSSRGRNTAVRVGVVSMSRAMPLLSAIMRLREEARGRSRIAAAASSAVSCSSATRVNRGV